MPVKVQLTLDIAHIAIDCEWKYVIVCMFPSCEVHLLACLSGSEADYVVLSMVRSKPLKLIKDKSAVLADRKWRMENLGMVADGHHLCVALTRARFGLVIIGELPLQISLSEHSSASLCQLRVSVQMCVHACCPVQCVCV